MSTVNIEEQLKAVIADVHDWPKPGIVFKDICPILRRPQLFRATCAAMADFISTKLGPVDLVVAPEARGFIFGCPVAIEANLPFVPVRKPKKLPGATESISYDLEYGSDTLCIQVGTITPGTRVAIVDDLLATGNTVLAIRRLIEQQGGIVVGAVFAIELDFIPGRVTLGLKDETVLSLVHY